MLSGTARKGRWAMGREHNAVAVMGGVDLDLREAELESQEVVIRVFALMGGIDIVVPEDCVLDASGFGRDGWLRPPRQGRCATSGGACRQGPRHGGHGGYRRRAAAAPEPRERRAARARAVKRLTSLDAQFLNIEDRTTTGHVGAVVLLDPAAAPGGDVTLDDVRAVLEPRLHLAAPFRQRLVEVPLGLGYPYWVEDPDFDLEYHLREVALPQPGTPEQLGEQVARIHSRQLDRSRPLWEMYLVHGLADGRLALYSKVHHAAIDGISGAEILAAIMDVTPEPREVDPEAWEPDRVPAPWEVLPRALSSVADRTRDLVTGIPRSLPHLAALPGAHQVPGVRAFGEALTVARAFVGLPPARGHSRTLTAPRTPFNGPITAHRRFAYASVPSRRGEAGQERVRPDRQRRRPRAHGRGAAPLAARPRRAAVRSPGRGGAGLGT